MDNILEKFMEDPERSYHIRELAKMAGRSPTTISSYLKKCERQGLLKSERKLNHLFFKADTGNKKFLDLKFYNNIKKLRSSGLIDFLVKNYHPEAIVLFGSFRKAENTPKSDIDLLLITINKKQINLSRYEKKLKHKIQLFLYSNQEILRLREKNKELLNTFVNGLVLEGFWEVLK